MMLVLQTKSESQSEREETQAETLPECWCHVPVRQVQMKSFSTFMNFSLCIFTR